jgi:hypothetical protein
LCRRDHGSNEGGASTNSAGGSSKSSPPSGAKRRRIASARFGSGSSRSPATAWLRIDRASASINRPCRAARTRNRSLTPASTLRIVSVASVISYCGMPTFYAMQRRMRESERESLAPDGEFTRIWRPFVKLIAILRHLRFPLGEDASRSSAMSTLQMRWCSPNRKPYRPLCSIRAALL